MPPLIGQLYYYIGKSNELHIVGEQYLAVETGQHWYRELGFVVWVTTEEDKNTKDPDYCMSCDLDYFHKNFKMY